MISKPQGIEDIFPDKMIKWNHLINSAKNIFKSYNYKEIIIPIMEYTEVFARGLGDETDIVSKEMYTFEDRGGRSLTLRPEGTASVVRAYIENGDYNRLSSVKLFYVGPMFRAERPQRGRLRQFNQFGAEFFGSDSPFYDYEIIAMVDAITRTVDIPNYTLLINSIGCPECRKTYIQKLYEFYTTQKDAICEDCNKRLEKNTLRLLDCKNEKCIEVRKSAPIITDYICGSCKEHHDILKSLLNDAGIKYENDPYLVRGLDYYTRTTFEFVSNDLGGQNAFAAGGRYDNLVEQFEGKPTPAVGFAAGIERMLLLLEKKEIKDTGIDYFIIHSGGDTTAKAMSILGTIRSKGFSADMDPDSSGFKSQFKKANRESASNVIVIGEDELASNTFSLKEMESGNQTSHSLDELDSLLGKNK